MGGAISHISIQLSWDLPMESLRHGDIISYDILYKNATTSIVATTTNTSIILRDLQEFVNYTISVRALTAIGPGPYSTPIIIMTDPYSKLHCI